MTTETVSENVVTRRTNAERLAFMLDKAYYLRCYKCNQRIAIDSTSAESAGKFLDDSGWYVLDENYTIYCPTCARDIRKE